MSDWGKGYVTDLQYTPAFCKEQSPSILRLACLLPVTTASTRFPSE